jgi:hypothetical protein
MTVRRGLRAAMLLGVAACCCLAAVAPSGAVGDAFSVVTVPTRPGVTVRLAVGMPAGTPAGVLVMFPGADGARSFRVSGGTAILGGNFLVRTAPMYVARGWAVAIVDVPSDHAGGIGDRFRASAEHATDIRAVVGTLAARSLHPIYLVGTSAGTTSVAYLGTALTDAPIDGIVLTSTMKTVVEFPLNRVKVPVLIIHHRADACKATPPAAAELLPRRFTGSSKVTFVWAQGGSTPQSDACEAFAAHGYIGIEAAVADVIVRWASGESVPAVVGQ